MSCNKSILEINITNIKENTSKIIKKYDDYKYYMAVVKDDCYGHKGIEVVKAIIEGGCNYLVVANLDEALKIRKEIHNIPILCLGTANYEFVDIYIENNITMTINSIEQLDTILNYKNLKVHIKINTGMNRLGLSEKEEFIYVYNKLVENNIKVEGIYTHIYEAEKKEVYQKQLQKFKKIIEEIDITNIPIIHIAASEVLVRYKKENWINGCRLGVILYGFISDKELNLKSTFSLYSQIIQISSLKKANILSCNDAYKAESDCLIGIVPIGYGNGIVRKNVGRNVFINNKEYPIIGEIYMDMLFVKIDNSVKINDRVIIFRDNEHIKKVALYLETIEEEILCTVGSNSLIKYI